MKFQKLLSLTFSITFALLASTGVSAQSLDEILYQQNIPEMIIYANTNIADEPAIADVFVCKIDLNTYSYEQIKLWKTQSQTPLISEMLQSVLTQKEVDIINEVQYLTAEQLAAYLKQFPERNDLVNGFLSDILISNLKEMSIFELIYLDACLPESYHDVIAEEIQGRSNEVNSVLKSNIEDYSTFEKKLAQRLKYQLETILWTYFVEGNKQLNNAYSQIGIVSDNPYAASEQYQSLVRMSFPVSMMQESLQKEVDQFCAQINNARKDYYTAMGQDKYSKLSYKVPVFVYDSTVSIDPLYNIAEARQKLVQNREDISTGTSVLGWLFGPVVGLVSKGIGDMFAVDSLVDSEYSARKAYMESVQEKMFSNFTRYSNTVISELNKRL